MRNRRKVIHMALATGAGAYWSKPIVNSVILPAHAQTSLILPNGTYTAEFKDLLTDEAVSACLLVSDEKITLREEMVVDKDGDMSIEKGIGSKLKGSDDILVVKSCSNDESRYSLKSPRDITDSSITFTQTYPFCCANIVPLTFKRGSCSVEFTEC